MTVDKNQQLTPLEEAKLETTQSAPRSGSLRDRLRELALSDDAAIRKAVASNPNTPTDILWKLADRFPRQLLENPVFELLILENPCFFGNIPDRTLKSLLRFAPESFFELLSRDIHHRVRREIASNSKTPLTILEKLATDPDGSVRREVANNSKTPGTVLEKLTGDGDPVVRMRVARNSNTTPTALEKLAGDKDPVVRRYLKIHVVESPVSRRRG